MKIRIYQLVEKYDCHEDPYFYDPELDIAEFCRIAQLAYKEFCEEVCEEYCGKNEVVISPEYLNGLPVGETCINDSLCSEYCYINICVYEKDIHSKIRVYSLDNGNDLFPSEYNVSTIDKFKDVLTAFYEALTASYPVTVKLEDISTDAYLESLHVGTTTIQYNYIYSDDTKSKGFCGFNIIVSEFEV